MSEATLMERLMAHSKFGKANVEKPPTNSEKWWAALVLGLLFALLSCSFLYGVTDTVTKSFGAPTWKDGAGPTLLGLLLHTIIFILLARILLA